MATPFGGLFGTMFNQPQYYHGLGIKSKANPLGGNIQYGMSKVPTTVGMDTPQGQKQVPIAKPPAIGVKAKSPVADIPAPSTTIPQSQQAPVQRDAGFMGNAISQRTGNGSRPQGGTPTTPQAPVTFPGLLQQSINQQNSPTGQQARQFTTRTADYGAGNIPIGKSAADIAADYGKKIADVGNRGAAFEAGQRTTGTNPVAQGNAAITAQTTAAQQQALATGESAALQGTGQQLTAQQQAANAANAAGGLAYTGQGQQIGALQGAAGLAQPQTQLGLLTNPQTGQPLNQGVIGNAVQQYVDLVRGGADPNDPNVSGLISSFGPWGLAMANSALGAGGGYNPTQQSAGAQQNAAQATATQGNNYALDTALKQLDTIHPLVTNFLNQSGLNSQDNPDFNAALNTYYGKFLSPGNKQLFEGYMGDIKKYTSQILAANSGTIPTDVSNTVASFDPSNLTVSQLEPYLNGLKQLGGNQLSVGQGQYTATGGVGGYIGTPTTATTQPVVAPNITPSSITSYNPIIQGLLGGAMNTFGGFTGMAKSFFSHL